MHETKPLSAVPGDATRGLSPGSQPRGIRLDVKNPQTGPQGGGLCLGGWVQGSAGLSQALAWVVWPRDCAAAGPRASCMAQRQHDGNVSSPSLGAGSPNALELGHCPFTKPPPGWCPVAVCSPPCTVPRCCLLQNQRWGKLLLNKRSRGISGSRIAALTPPALPRR